MAHPKKQQKTNRRKVVKSTEMRSKWGGPFGGRNAPNITTNSKNEKMTYRDVPGSKRHPKSVKEASKLHPKPFKRLPNQSKLDPTDTKTRKSQGKELQRTMHHIRASHLNKNRSTCKADLSSHLDCSHLSSVLLSDMQALSMSTFHAGVQV